ncbi:MAG: ABC transporter ATP-binding protein [Candidatus Latescibacteria bacterium]|jgi:ABC-type lipoprotein export system ATPase subunit|nr:ABC transporter ATP-binding protein [Candidatus Latescibacterota bacterium]
MTQSQNDPALLELEDVRKTYALPAGQEPRQILQGTSMEVRRGESVSIVGPSGSGKSTLLNLMGGLDDPTSGTVRFLGRDLASLSDRERAQIRNQEIGFVFQLHHLLPQCTVLENVLIPAVPFGSRGTSGETADRARGLCDRVGLSRLVDGFPAQLSGGEQQRVAVVRALINQPKLILADEPTGSLDLDSSENLVQLLLELNREEGAALVVVTHSADVAEQMDRTCQLQAGRLV